jgi:hypothetical protein
MGSYSILSSKGLGKVDGGGGWGGVEWSGD